MFYTIFRRLFFVLSQQYICYLHDHIMMDKTTSKISDPHKILLAGTPVPGSRGRIPTGKINGASLLSDLQTD